jgi:hypothetical protein
MRTEIKNVSAVKFKAINKANENLEFFSNNRLIGISDLETVNAIVTSNKAVAAVWGDICEPDRCGILFIKGCEQDFLQLPDNEVSAVHCRSIEEAVALKQVFGAVGTRQL